MRQTAAVAFALVLLAAGASAEDTQRYLVATKQPFRAGAVAAVLRDARQGMTLRDVAGFESFDGFGAELTSSEVAALRRNAAVRWVEPVVERVAFGTTPRKLDGQAVPYGVDLIRAREAWAARRGGIVDVVVIDTGVDYRHPEFQGIWAGGFDVINNDTDPDDDHGHGTHVAGTIAAANNEEGVVGAAPDVRLWGVKALKADGKGVNEGIIRAVDWVRQKKQERGGRWVVNLSLGGSPSEAEREAFSRGSAEGIIFVAASGNNSVAGQASPVLFPAAYNGVIAVGAIDDRQSIAEFSNQGPELDVVAHGVTVLSTVRRNTGAVGWTEHGGNKYLGRGLTGAKMASVSGEYVYCGLGRPEDFPANIAGKIALIKRGEIRFTAKTQAAKERGAIGVAIFNHDESSMDWTLWPDDDPAAKTYDWPVTIGLTRQDGENLVANNAGTITLVHQTDDYGYGSGTSMATPHVAAAAALLWSIASDAAPSDIVNALTSTASDLGPGGRDDVYGYGVIDVYRAARLLAPSAFDPTNPPPGSRPSTGRRILKRH